MFLANLALLCRVSIGDVRQTVDTRERFSDGTLRQFRWQIILYTRGILHMRRITWPVSRGSKRLHFWNPRPRFAYSLYNFYWAMTMIKGRLLWSVTNVKALDCVNFLCVTVWPRPLTFWPWSVLVHNGSHDQPCHQIWRPYGYSFMSYEL